MNAVSRNGSGKKRKASGTHAAGNYISHPAETASVSSGTDMETQGTGP